MSTKVLVSQKSLILIHSLKTVALYQLFGIKPKGFFDVYKGIKLSKSCFLPDFDVYREKCVLDAAYRIIRFSLSFAVQLDTMVRRQTLF
jgi:hypothetical protein